MLTLLAGVSYSLPDMTGDRHTTPRIKIIITKEMKERTKSLIIKGLQKLKKVKESC